MSLSSIIRSALTLSFSVKLLVSFYLWNEHVVVLLLYYFKYFRKCFSDSRVWDFKMQHFEIVLFFRFACIHFFFSTLLLISCKCNLTGSSEKYAMGHCVKKVSANNNHLNIKVFRLYDTNFEIRMFSTTMLSIFARPRSAVRCTIECVWDANVFLGHTLCIPC